MIKHSLNLKFIKKTLLTSLTIYDKFSHNNYLLSDLYLKRQQIYIFKNRKSSCGGSFKL